MKTFRTSTAARIISSAIAFALIAGGLIPVSGVSAVHAVPVVFLVALAACLFGVALALTEYPGSAISLAIGLPILFWPFVMGLTWMASSRPELGWGLVVLGLGMAASMVVAPMTARRLAPKASTSQHSARA